ncbi:hypothetical protein UFOVP1058_67 [uncultured Caudovirales phage]|uniref:Uncharacterized protein n=1 Tax=uncultured Caudovirales phage TaxID=2100421 RepID=A0A6J5PEE4_9CAUD|nr:hypothetical protein UFOVP656_13 [uncultured Caudovirales phage]CAB4167638.1 hypothetical protein UFOVP857_35 [uncultured Caudovirales phage]CAB4168377.1 hypothetical protein UFOVP879_11 [uncultured Caudovirales phage]CAB4181813.1 hypothetical protein UFOVP1058_67 [uncultured Caudovirales phage]CAB4195453.1 hypothetical protein UFOVP1289_22 [uncultured Caudovirales phage]
MRKRGKGKAPSKLHVTLRIPADALEFYKQFQRVGLPYTEVMRNVLVAFYDNSKAEDGE